MKKNTVKKLVLSKETVKNLDRDKLQEVAGGMVSIWGCYSVAGGRCTSDVC